MPDLIEFLLLHLPEAEWTQLDEHQPKRFAFVYEPPDRSGEWRLDHREGCVACTKNPSRTGEAPYGTSWIESWPCRHLCTLALPFADQPGFHPWWRERPTLGPQVI